MNLAAMHIDSIHQQQRANAISTMVPRHICRAACREQTASYATCCSRLQGDLLYSLSFGASGLS